MNTMNRCLTRLSRPFFLASVLLISPVSAVQAQGFVRPFPESALRGAFQMTTPPEVLINGKPTRLAPGARIKNANNMLTLSASLGNNTYLVNYTRDMQGLVRDVWILTPAEARQEREGMNTSNVHFESDAPKGPLGYGKRPTSDAPTSRP